MSGTCLRVCSALEGAHEAVLAAVAEVASGLDLPFVLVGACARDLWLYHLHGISPIRRTLDVDFGVAVADWGCLELLRERLATDQGFVPSTDRRHPERLTSPAGVAVDLLPFGGVTNPVDGNIKWPPDGVTMGVLGFAEAQQTAATVLITDRLAVPVARPAALVLLKLVAWRDRESVPEARRKHVADIVTIAQHYLRLSHPDADPLAGLPDAWGQDALLGGLWLVGRDAAAIAGKATYASVEALLQSQATTGGRRNLVRDLNKELKGQWQRAEQSVSALYDGFRQSRQGEEASCRI